MAVAAFLAFWLLLGGGLVFVALSGGPAGARERWHTQTRRGRRGATFIFAVIYIGLGIAVPTVVIASDTSSDEVGKAGLKLDASQKRGRTLFAKNCGTCHTLAAASTSGKVGTNLDTLRPPKTLVLDALMNGRAQGNGQMPAGLLQGRDANDVANFVSYVAGKQ